MKTVRQQREGMRRLPEPTEKEKARHARILVDLEAKEMEVKAEAEYKETIALANLEWEKAKVKAKSEYIEEIARIKVWQRQRLEELNEMEKRNETL